MPEILLNGRPIAFAPGNTVAAVVLRAGVCAFRGSVTGERRGPLCGMGICYECRVTIDGEPHARSCQIACLDGMVVETA